MFTSKTFIFYQPRVSLSSPVNAIIPWKYVGRSTENCNVLRTVGKRNNVHNLSSIKPDFLWWMALWPWVCSSLWRTRWGPRGRGPGVRGRVTRRRISRLHSEQTHRQRLRTWPGRCRHTSHHTWHSSWHVNTITTHAADILTSIGRPGAGPFMKLFSRSFLRNPILLYD